MANDDSARTRRSTDDDDADDGDAGTSPPSIDLVCFSLIIDDIVSWDGRTSMGSVGGGGPQVLWGYAVAAAAMDGDGGGNDESSNNKKRRQLGRRIALAAGVGEGGHDLPANVTDWLSGTLGADLSGLRPTPGAPTPRAWQLLERDGRRTQVWRSSGGAESATLYEQLRPPFESLPARLRQSARSYHVGLHAAHPPKSLLKALRGAVDARRAEEAAAGGGRGLLSAETYTRCEAGPLSARQLRELLDPLDVFSPNEEEAASMLGVRLLHGAAAPPATTTRGRGGGGPDDYDEEAEARAAVEAERVLLDALLDAAPERGGGRPPLTVTLRRGARGALAKTGGGGNSSPCVCVPAARGLSVVDPVGCGNAFCGGFLAAAHAGLGLRDACAWGCAAGGTMAEHEGVPRPPLRSLAPAVARRARELVLRVKGAGDGFGQGGKGQAARRFARVVL